MRPRQKRINKELARQLTDQIMAGERKQIDVAKEYGITRQAVNNWVKKRRHPELFIVPHQIESPPPKLSAKDAKTVAAAIRSGRPSKFGLMIEQDLWVPIAVRDLIEDLLNRTVPIATVNDLIRREKLEIEDHAPPIDGLLNRGRPFKNRLALPLNAYTIGRRGGKRVATHPEPASTEFYQARLREL